jgi:hypothetical protein
MLPFVKRRAAELKPRAAELDHKRYTANPDKSSMACGPEASVSLYQITRRQIPQDACFQVLKPITTRRGDWAWRVEGTNSFLSPGNMCSVDVPFPRANHDKHCERQSLGLDPCLDLAFWAPGCSGLLSRNYVITVTNNFAVGGMETRLTEHGRPSPIRRSPTALMEHKSGSKALSKRAHRGSYELSIAEPTIIGGQQSYCPILPLFTQDHNYYTYLNKNKHHGR